MLYYISFRLHIMIQYLYIYCEMVTKMSLFNTNHQVYFQICNAVLTIVTILYIIAPWLIYLITGSVYVWPLSSSLPTPTPCSCLWQPQSVLSVYELGFWLCFFLIPHIRKMLQMFVCLCLTYFTYHKSLHGNEDPGQTK